MAAFPGFGISGYRTLAGEIQWIPLDPAITVFLGGNNSGKSNILRLLHTHMGSIFRSLNDGAALNTFDPRLDAPRDSRDAGLHVIWPLDVDGLVASGRFDGMRDELQRILGLPELNQCGVPSLPFTAGGLTDRLGISIEFAKAVTESSIRQINWQHLSSNLVGMSGGAPGEDAQRILQHLKQWCVPPPETELVPPSRALRGGGDPARWDFSGEGMIDQLKSPQFDEDELRERDAALTRDLRVLLEDDELDMNVQHDRSTLNVRLGRRWFPLASLGTGTEHAVVILAARHVYPDKLLCLEEPDAHLHPRLQRRLVSLLRDTEGRQVAIATHSAHMIDAADTVVAVHLEEARSSVALVGDHALFELLRALGYRASDLLQTNCIIWVEGPSDRIYLLHWINAIAPDLIEGVDFSIAFYGGALLARLSAAVEDVDDPTLVDLWRINRRMWVLMDSDKGEGELRPAVQRLRAEIVEAGSGGTWVTSGYTIENYVRPDVLETAVRSVHPSVARIANKKNNIDPLAKLVREDRTRFTRVDKVAIALAVCEQDADLDVMDLRRAERSNKVIWETVVKVSKRAGVRATAHGLRRAFAVAFLTTNPGAIEALQALMNHSRIDTTIRSTSRL